MFSLAWIVPWAAPDAFTKHLNPATSDVSGETAEAYNNWPNDTPAAQRTIAAWEQVQNNRAPTDEAQAARDEAYLTMEEANWADVANLPVYHEISERFWYDRADVPRFGVGGAYRQKFNGVTLRE
jgi:peptide/nickel transport system substrate-binding protein